MSSDTVRLSIAVTAVPERQRFLDDLLAWLGPLDPPPQVYLDPDHNGPWWNTRRAWLGTPEWATHRLVLQEDVQPSPDFVAAVVAALRLRPASFISFLNTDPQPPGPFVPYTNIHGAAACLPAAWTHEFVAWADSLDYDFLPDLFFIPARLPERVPHDDDLLWMWLWETGRDACAVSPSLVRHAGGDDSTVGHSRAGATGDDAYWYWWGEYSALDLFAKENRHA